MNIIYYEVTDNLGLLQNKTYLVLLGSTVLAISNNPFLFHKEISLSYL